MMHPDHALFLDTPAQFDKRIERMVSHLRHAEFIHQEGTKDRVQTPAKLIWLLFQDAMQTNACITDKELNQVRRVACSLPSGRRSEFEAHVTMAQRFKEGMPIFDRSRIRRQPRAADIDRMVDVLDLLRFVTGADAKRQKVVFLARASGLSLEQCGRIYDRHRAEFSRQTMYSIRQAVVGQVMVGLDRHFGLVRTGRFFRRLTIREIEQRSKRDV